MSSIGQNQYSHAASRFTGRNQMLMSSPGTNETILLDLDTVPVGHVVGRTASGVGTFAPSGAVSFPLLAPTTTATTPSYAFSATSQDGLYFDGTNIGVGRADGLALRTPAFGCFTLGATDCPTPDTSFSAGIIATSNSGGATPAPTITAASGNAGCCIAACEHIGTGTTNDMSITGASGSAILASRSGSNTLGSRIAIQTNALANLVASCLSDGQGGAITTAGTGSTVIASRASGAVVSVGGVAGIVAGTSAGSCAVTISGTANAAIAVSGNTSAGLARIIANSGLLAACTVASTGTLEAGGNSSALVAVRLAGLGTLNQAVVSGTAAAIIASNAGATGAGSTTSAGGIANLIAACNVTGSGGSLTTGNLASCALACSAGPATLSSAAEGSVIMAMVGAVAANSVSTTGVGAVIAGLLHQATGSVSTTGTGCAILAVETGGTGTSNQTVASGSSTAIIASRTGANTAGSTTSAGGQAALIAACMNSTNAGSITTLGNGQAVIACDPNGGTVALAASAGASAAIACGTGISLQAARTFIAAAQNSTCDAGETNSAIIGGTGLNSNGSNSLTSQTMFASAFNVTCDASEKAEMEDTSVPRAEFITKLKATKPKRYRLKAEDKGAKKRRGFDAADLEAFDDVIVKTGRREIEVRQTEDGKWEDKEGKKYNNADPDSDGENDDDEDDRPRGKVYRDKQLSHAYVDVTAMLSLVWEGLQHMQSQIDELKAAKVSVKVGL